MRMLVLSLVSSVMIASSVSASAECYGDAATQYGCNSDMRSTTSQGSGELVHFGGDSDRVLPDYGKSSSRSITTDDLFTAAEQRQMLKSIVVGNGTSLSRSAFTRSMHAGARPLRSYGNRPFITRVR
jgi:hypothetical protein